MSWAVKEARDIAATTVGSEVHRLSTIVARLANVVAEIAEDVEALIERQDS